MDGDVEPAVAAGQPGVGNRVGELIDQRAVGWRVAGGGDVSPGRSLDADGRVEHAGPITVSLKLIANGTSVTPLGFVDTPVDNATGVTGRSHLRAGRSTMSK